MTIELIKLSEEILQQCFELKVASDQSQYKKLKKEWENCPYSIEEMMFYDDLFDGD